MTDNKLKIKISKQMANYDVSTDTLVYSQLSVSRFRKNGYLVYDEAGNNIGIAFMSDDKRKNQYGSTDIVFYAKYKNQYGVWRNIKINGQYLPYEKLEQILKAQNEFVITTDARHRKG